MSPSRGDQGAPDGPQALQEARKALRELLAELHVLDALPERSRMLAVDAELPVHVVLSTVLSEQHPQPAQRSTNPTIAGLSGGSGSGQNGGADSAGSGGPPGMRREGAGAAPEEPPLAMSCGIVSPSLPSNVLAEVCEFDPCGVVDEAAKAAAEGEGSDDKQSAVRRQWTSPDDGWGMHMSIPMQDLEKMPMGMPVTVGELADFLAHACVSPAADEGGAAAAAPQRWASSAGGSADDKDGAAAAADMLDWSLTQWRAHRLKARSDSKEAATPLPGDVVEPTSRLFVEERPRGRGPVLVHRVPSAPPRPILCTDDPDASLLTAVELLLAYPELDALPIVSPVRCTVVAHLTLSYCLAYTLGRMRGNELTPLANLVVSAESGDGGAASQRQFDRSKVPADGRPMEAWAERTNPEAVPSPWVLLRSQPVRDLLAFFASTHHSGLPIVEDGGGVLGLLSRRDLLHFLDLSMQSAGRDGAEEDADRIIFDVAAPVEVVLEALKKFRSAPVDEEAANGVGASLIYDKELTIKEIALRVLIADNRKLLFVRDGGGGKAPRLLRMMAVTDVWGLLIGSEQERADASGEKPSETLKTEEL